MEGGGTERVAALLCNHWVAQGHEVTLMPTFSGRGKCLYPLDERVHLTYLADLVGNTSRTLWNTARRVLALRRVIRGWLPDVVVSFLVNVNVTVLLSSRGLSVPVVVSERNYPPMQILPWPMNGMRRFTYRWAQTVVTQTSGIAQWIKEYCPGSSISIIPNPVVMPLPAAEPRLSPEYWLEPGRKVVLAVGRLEIQKGFDTLLEVFARMADKHPEWSLAILGEGKQRQALEEQRDNLGLDRRVHLPGRVGNMADWYSRADVYVMSSRFEGFPNTLIEAMAHGLPVVSFDCETGPRDIIHPEVDGLLVAQNLGVSGLVSALESLINDDALRARMGKEAKHVRERFSIESITELWANVLKLKS